MRTMLMILPYAGWIITTLSTIWGLTHELYTKDENNKRHLTKAGKYSIAFALIGLLISFNTAALKTITDNQDKAIAKAEDDRKRQEEALEKLSSQQREEARAQESRDEARTTQEKIDREAQEQRDNDLAQKQRDLSLSQQQIEGFSRTESLARQQTLAEIQRGNKLLFNINRGQYPITGDLKITPFIRVWTNHPLLKEYASQIAKKGKELYESEWQRYQASGDVTNLSGENRDSLVLDEKSPLLPKDSRVRGLLLSMEMNFVFFAKDSDIFNRRHGDLSFYYRGLVFGETSGYHNRLTYRPSDSSFGIIGPTITPSHIEQPTGKLISYLDLSGATVLMLSNSELRFPCEEISKVEKILITTPSGFQLEFPSRAERESQRNPIKCQSFGSSVAYPVYVFNANADKFLDIYASQR